MVNYKKVLCFLGGCCLFFVYSYFFSTLFNDEIWNYGFSYNIANGLVPYRDFNMIITPLYSFIGSIFIIVFGHHLWSIHILNSIMIVFMLWLIYRKIGKKVLLFVPVLLLYCYPGYNLFSVFLIIILLYICEEDFKYYDFIMGLLCGLLFLTKQTIGICMFVPMIYYSKRKIKSIISFLCSILIFIIYLVWNNAFYQFIDYCFLGMFDFGNHNKVLLFLPIEIFICVFLGIRLLKSKFLDKRVFYLLMFQIVTVPIMDDYHFMIGFMPVYLYILDHICMKDYRFKYYVIIAFFSFGFWNYMANGYSNIYLYQDKKSYLYGRYIPEYIEKNITDISEYMESIKDDFDYVFLLTQNSYMVKLNTSYSINKFDLINNGNMGYRGSEKYIQELKDQCERKKCLFMIYKYEIDVDNPKGNQTNFDILNYVSTSYDMIQEVSNFILYES